MKWLPGPGSALDGVTVVHGGRPERVKSGPTGVVVSSSPHSSPLAHKLLLLLGVQIDNAWNLLTTSSKLIGWARAWLGRNLAKRFLHRVSHSEQVAWLVSQAVFLALFTSGA